MESGDPESGHVASEESREIHVGEDKLSLSQGFEGNASPFWKHELPGNSGLNLGSLTLTKLIVHTSGAFDLGSLDSPKTGIRTSGEFPGNSISGDLVT